jgi:hypothetical protein
MLYRIYNYPWSGKLGRIAERCIYCGNNGPAFHLSSAGTTCCEETCRAYRQTGAKPAPAFEAKFKADYERLAKEWCLAHNIDYDQTIKDLAEKYNGPPDQER